MTINRRSLKKLNEYIIRVSCGETYNTMFLGTARRLEVDEILPAGNRSRSAAERQKEHAPSAKFSPSARKGFEKYLRS